MDISLTATVALVFSSRPFQTVANDPRPIGWLFSEEKIAYSFPVFAFLIILVLLVLGVFDDEVGCLGRLGRDIFLRIYSKTGAFGCKEEQTPSHAKVRISPRRNASSALLSSALFSFPNSLPALSFSRFRVEIFSRLKRFRILHVSG